jgi:UDP-N-acetylmuramoyl-tripeptide--D-alanyl-D-alanine ligase
MKTEEIYKLFRESSGISTDTRSISEGKMFFALWGDKYNGNKFAPEALEKGASWAIIDDPAYESEKTILVDDCLFELQALATFYRKELNIPVISVTGSNGKTTTKEILAAVLSRKYRVHATPGNLNNLIGVPLTILSAPADTEMMVIEMGASHVGEIRSLCLIAKPDYGIITNISTSHLEGFGTFDGIVRTKTELFEYLRKTNGIALYNDKDPVISEKIYKIVNRAIPFSNPTGVELVIYTEPSGLSLVIKVKHRDEVFTINTNLFGAHNIENIRAAIATGLFLGIEMRDIAAAVGSHVPGNNRSQIRETGKNTLVCDSYNANPASMKMAIESFASSAAGNKMCILGDMLELGDKSGEEHVTILKTLQALNFTSVLLAGPVFSRVSRGSGFRSFPNVRKLKEYLQSENPKGYHILIKGSRGMAMEQVYDLL